MSKKKEEPIRIAQIIGKWLGGGVEAVVMNYYRHIDRNKIQFDFICDEDSTNIPYEEIESLGGKVILIPPYQKVFKYHKELKRVLKEGNYKIVHSHINTLSVFSLFAAKCAGVPVRIAHSHSVIINDKKEYKRNIIKKILRLFSKTFATNYCACSESAAISQFGLKTFKEGKVKIIYNAIDIDKFKFNKQLRAKVRKNLNINDSAIVIGHVGRLVETKNQLFLLDIFNEYNKINKNSFLVLIGQGPMLEQIKIKIKKTNLTEKVLLLGQRNDINELYNAFDCFVFPSLYEGLGMSLIEAQINGLYCIASSRVPLEVKISNHLDFVDLSSSINIWANKVKKNNRRLDAVDESTVSKYNIDLQNKSLEDYYYVVGDINE